jgi:hypothetical protein
LTPPKQRKKLTDPKTRPCLLLGYKENMNYCILLEDSRIIGTPNAEFHEVLTTPSTQTKQDVGAESDNSPRITAAVAEGSEIIGLINQLSVSIQHASVPASECYMSMAPRVQTLPRPNNDNSQERMSQLSDENSQPVAGLGDRICLPTRSDDTLGPFSDGLQDIIQRSDSTPSGDQ